MFNDELERFHKRKHPRLKNYDYKQQNCYFVTICTNEKRCIFGSPEQLSAYGTIDRDALALIPSHYPDVEVHKYVVMPNHIHAIVNITRGDIDLSVIMGQYKRFVTKQIRQIAPKLSVWQTSFHDHVIRGEADYRRIWEYIDTNPVKWQLDCFYTAEQN